MEWLKTNAMKVIILIQFIVILFGGVLLFKGGIHVVSQSTSNSQSISYANSWAGSLAVGSIGGDYRGKWEIKQQTFETDADLYNCLQSLDPIQYMCVKVVYNRYSGVKPYMIFYPVISTLQSYTHKDSGVKTETNSKVIR